MFLNLHLKNFKYEKFDILLIAEFLTFSNEVYNNGCQEKLWQIFYELDTFLLGSTKLNRQRFILKLNIKNAFSKNTMSTNLRIRNLE